MNEDHQKTDWVTEPLRYPRQWQRGAESLARATFQPRANILRRALRAGLLIVARQEDVSEKSLCEMMSVPDLAPALGRPKLPPHGRQGTDTDPTGTADRRAGSLKNRRGQKNPGHGRPAAEKTRPASPAPGPRAGSDRAGTRPRA